MARSHGERDGGLGVHHSATEQTPHAVAAPPTQQTRPGWAEGARGDLGAFEKQTVYSVFYNL